MRQQAGKTCAAVALTVLVTALTAALPAVAFGSVSVTRGVVGYGTVHVNSGPADCTSAESNPGGTNVNVNAGAESDCAAFDATSYDSCSSPDVDGNFTCDITLHAVAPGAGWQFDHWSGDCSGTTASCTLATTDTECDSALKPPCHTTSFGPYTAVAHFVDTRAPTPSFTQAPANNSTVYSDAQSQQFAFHTDEDGESPSFVCQRDSGAFAGCSSGITWSSIADGIHDFCIKATDASGLGGNEACVHWEQETNPTATINTEPPSATASSSASFTYTSNKASHPADGSTLSYRCALDTTTFTACPASGESYDDLGDGQHVFKVEAVFHGALEAVGTTHTSAPQSYTWTVDSTPPDLNVTSGPANGATFGPHGTQAWTFETSDATTEVASVQCKLDSGAFAACTSPTSESVADAAPGLHTLTIKATDSAGNARTVARSWKIDGSGPVIAMTSGPANGALLTATSVTWTWHSNEHATFRCRLYVAALTPPAFGNCSGGSSHTAAGLAPGTYSFEVVGTDAYGNVGHLVKRTFTIVRGRISAKVAARWRVHKGRTTVRKLRLTRVARGATVTVKCKGKGCPKGKRTLHAAGGGVNLKPLFHKPLRAGATISIRITAPGWIGQKVAYKVRKRGKPKKTTRSI